MGRRLRQLFLGNVPPEHAFMRTRDLGIIRSNTARRIEYHETVVDPSLADIFTGPRLS
jgi:hypothetical protein